MPPAFDAYLVIDWSARSTPATGADSVWIAEARRVNGGLRVGPLRNPRTRHDACEHLRRRLRELLSRGRSVLVGFDFAFGYPAGTAAALALSGTAWSALWSELADRVRDDAHNRNNRWEVAAGFNHRLGGGPGPFWGVPAARASASLTARRVFDYPVQGLAERRLTDDRVRGPQPVWKLLGVGSVGSQSLLGIPRLEALRQQPGLADRVRVWPFESAEPEGGRAVFAEVYPSLVQPETRGNEPKDAGQVRALARQLGRWDVTGELVDLLSIVEALSSHDRARAREEGWILGVR